MSTAHHHSSPPDWQAFRKTFDAMKLLIDPGRQAARLRQINRGVDGGDADGADGEDADLPEDTKWWAAASVGEMEQAFRNLEEFLQAQVAPMMSP